MRSIPEAGTRRRSMRIPRFPAKAVSARATPNPPSERSWQEATSPDSMARLNARKAALEAELGEPAVYQDPDRVRSVLADQAYVAKELDALETEWLEMNA